MREIKFRAWDKSAKKYRYPKLWDNTMPSNWEQHYELEQFTGLKDKNGVDIYEGDILRSPTGEIFKVVFRNGAFVFRRKDGVLWSIKYNLSAWEIIGNFHQNTELLDPR